ncbi:MAG: YdeI/OmpD-associated family protein [Deltaproteobacteria bacterium]|nr:YdeI/OmpD-associated family protein [Deltaproteobacteria bacterium]
MEFEQVHPGDRAKWRAWLKAHHLSSPGIWLVIDKKVNGHQPLSYEEICEELVCFGWVDSRPRKLDERRSMLLCTPRKPKSGWAKPNKDRVAKMEAAGMMAPAGSAAVAEAKRSGTWNKLDAVEALEIPEDLTAALVHHRAQENFEAFPRSVKRGILEWISTAKRPETRAARITETATLATKNERANQWRPKDPADQSGRSKSPVSRKR